jgi:hypothetical protein
MLFSGQTWEGRVRKAQQKAFQLSYELVRKEEKLDYSVNRIAR